MHAGSLLKQLLPLMLTVLFGTGAAESAVQPTIDDGWTRSCTGNGSARRCVASFKQKIPDYRKGSSGVTVMIRQDTGCHSLHIVFDAPIAVDRPVRLTIDGGPRIGFYTNPQLVRLARAVDDGVEPRGLPAEFIAFYRDVEAGRIGRGDAAGAELIARFAQIKEARRAGMACIPTERLLPDLRTGQVLHLDFWAETYGPARIYHWPQLSSRSIEVPLRGLAAILDGIAPAN
jgi:hypothetical protein